MNKIKLLVVIIIIFNFTIIAEENNTGNKEFVKSLKEERLDTIKYGISTQVTDLIDILENEKNYDFNKDLLKLLESSTNSKLDQKIINLFEKSKDDSAVEYVFTQLQEDFNLRNDIRIVYINYLSKYQTHEISEYLVDLIEEDNNSISIAAIKALGESDLDNINRIFIDHLEDTLFDSLRKPAIIESLGKLKALEALEILTDIATDEYSDDKSSRWRAVVALGEIGSPESLPVLKSLFTDKDPNLRNYTISALKHYTSKEVGDLLIQGLKDSFWKVRINAAHSLGELRIKEAVPILIYKTEKDPDIRNVRAATLNALGEIGGSDAYNFIRELYKNERTDIGLRSIAIGILAENDLSKSLKIINSVLEAEWEKEKPLILDYTCKILSTTKASSLKGIYLKMLSYDKTLNLKLYALRGIKLNRFSSLKNEVENLTTDGTHDTIKKLALDVLKNI